MNKRMDSRATEDELVVLNYTDTHLLADRT